MEATWRLARLTCRVAKAYAAPKLTVLPCGDTLLITD